MFCLSYSEELNSLKILLNSNGVKGSVVIKEVGNKSIFTNDSLKANEEYKPASTFKILHTLIALDGKYISELDTIKWDKKIRAIDLWNSDQTLKSAFKYSCVWAYEAIEKRIGIVNYQKYLDQSNYGNLKVGIIDTAFWLYGDLRISAIEQIHFLELLYLRKLGFKDHSYEVLKEIMLDSKTDNYQIYGKTGWVDDIGWYVGYVETKKGVWLFATRLEGVNMSNGLLQLRKELTMKALIQLKIIEVG